MPNDLVSREAVMAAVVRVVNAVFDLNKGSALDESGEERDIFQREVIEEIKAAIAALPDAGDERWEKLEAAACEVISEADYQHGRSPHCFTEALGDAINNLRRALSPPPQEAGDEPGE